MINVPKQLCLFALILCCATSLPANAQTDDGPVEPSTRPTIGLALSGGGAKGLAHIGVLKKLEEWNIPVDYIAGTSMGAVIGGLYASGMTADEIETAVLDIDWTDLLQDDPLRKERSFRRKEEDRLYLLDFEFGQRGLKLIAPRGFRQGQKLTYMLRNLTQPVAGITDFNELPVPFRAVATNLVNGDMVVLDQGDLAAAIRASMAIPGVFAPVEIGDLLLVDGGSVRNIPVDVVRAMGADIVIAVDISAPLGDREKLKSSLAVTGQTLGFLTRLNVEAQLPLADLVLRPAVAGIGVLDFSDPPSIISLGIDEAELKKSVLDPMGLPVEEYTLHRAGQVVPHIELPLITSLRITGLEKVSEEIVRRRIRLQPGDRLNFDALYVDLARIYGLGGFESVDFSLNPEEEGVELVIQAQEKEWGPNYVRFGLAFLVDEDQGATFNLKMLHRATSLNRWGAEWRSMLQVGRVTSLTTEFYQPFDYNSRWFIMPGLYAGNELVNSYLDGENVAEFKQRLTYGYLDFGYQLGNKAQIRLGPAYGAARFSRSVGVDIPQMPKDPDGSPGNPEGLASETPTLGGARLLVSIDTQDEVTFPRRGGFGEINTFISREFLGADTDYERIEGKYIRAFSRGRHTVFGSVAGGTSLGGELPVYHQFTLGGMFSLSGFAPDELRGNYFAVGRVGYYASLFKLPTTMGQNLFFGGWIEKGNTWYDSSDISWDNTFDTITVSVGADTVFGPMYFAWGKGPGGRSQYLLSLGSGF